MRLPLEARPGNPGRVLRAGSPRLPVTTPPVRVGIRTAPASQARLLDAVRHGYAMAECMAPGPEKVLTAVLARGGEVIAFREVGGPEQASLLRDMLAPFGFVQVDPGPAEEALGCRFVLRHVPGRDDLR